MTLDEAVARLQRMRERRLVRAEEWRNAATEFTARAVSADEVLERRQRDLLAESGVIAERRGKSAQDDADALEAVLAFVASQTIAVDPT